MTPRLETVIKTASTLSPELQDLIAEEIIAIIEDEQRWDETFAKSHHLLEAMAKRALRARQEGKTINKGWDEI